MATRAYWQEMILFPIHALFFTLQPLIQAECPDLRRAPFVFTSHVPTNNRAVVLVFSKEMIFRVMALLEVLSHAALLRLGGTLRKALLNK